MDQYNRNPDLAAIKYFLGFISLVIFVIILKELRTIFMPFCFALLLYFLVHAISQKLVRKNMPKILVLFSLLVLLFIIIYIFGVLFFTGVSSFVDRFPAYSKKITAVLNGVFEKIELPFKSLDELIADFDWSKILNQVTGILSNTFESFAAIFGKTMLIIIFLIFMLAGRDSLVGRIKKSFDKPRASKILKLIDQVEGHVQHYLVIKIGVSFLTALVSGIILVIGGFNIVIFSVVLIFILNFIPNFGSIIATIFPITLGLIDYGLSFRVIIVASGLMLAQFLIGNLLEPKVTGRNLDISPIVILISLIFWGYVWGIVGMVLAVPLTSALKLIFEKINGLKPIASLISSK